jgi:NAD(P)-dependent dehydrogenase (short-subunit alcohol dehydrogenase family)
MKIELLPLEEQVMVITGASSGIGLVTAKQAARRGARVVLAARNESDLRQAVEEIRSEGGRAVYVVADVSDPRQVERIAAVAVQEFGRIDTWVNNAAVSIYGRVMEVSLEDLRRQMDVNYWGQVHGSRVAVGHLGEHGGALINVGSALSDRAIPLQTNYCAAKHAIKAFTDGLRMELEEQGLPISVTLVKPASIDTPFFEKAKTYLSTEPQPVPPVYAPEVVADVILAAAERPVREVIAGGAGVKVSAARFAPRLADLYMERWTFDSQSTGQPTTADRPHNLFMPVASDGGERGRNWQGHTRESSVYTKAVLNPRAAAAVVGLCAVAAGLLMARPSTQRLRQAAGRSFRPPRFRRGAAGRSTGAHAPLTTRRAEAHPGPDAPPSRLPYV